MKVRIIVVMIMVLLIISPPNKSFALVNPKQIYTFERYSQDITQLNRKYPNESQLFTIGKTHFGRPIWAMKIGKGKRHVLITGAHHGREWLTATLLMKMMEEYLNALQNGLSYGPYYSDVFNEVSLWVVPMVNPDGVAIQQKGLIAAPVPYQKQLFFMNELSPDFSKWKANGVGIDLNRQYAAGWKQFKGGPVIPWYQYYKGNHPVEAKEVQALVAFTDQIKPQVAIAYHSSGREIYWKYKNQKQHLKRDKRLAKKVSKLTHYPLSTPAVHAIGGGFTDWFITKYHKPGMTIEISYSVGETNPPLSVFKEEWQRNKYVGIMLATEIAKLEKSKRTHSDK